MKYYYLKKGEEILSGDEVDMCNDGWRDDPMWIPAKNVGEKAVDPQFISHRKYRRKLTTPNHGNDRRIEDEDDSY